MCIDGPKEVVGTEIPGSHHRVLQPEVPQTSCIRADVNSLARIEVPAMPDDSTAPENISRRLSRRPGQTVECGWCGQPVEVPARGRVPLWCSSSCRHRAWESRRANRDPQREVRVVTRTVEVERAAIRSVEVPVPTEPRTAEEWATLLVTFATRLAQGRIYRRDLPTLEPAVRRLADVWLRTINQSP